jgi:hypothetical protein
LILNDLASRIRCGPTLRATALRGTISLKEERRSEIVDEGVVRVEVSKQSTTAARLLQVAIEDAVRSVPRVT